MSRAQEKKPIRHEERDPRNTRRLWFAVAASIAMGVGVTAGCADTGADAGNLLGAWRARVDTIADTIVVRTLSGSTRGTAALVAESRIGTLDGADHEIFGNIVGLTVTPSGDLVVYDYQVPALRRFAADGRYLGTLGRQGSGPGEYANSDGGLIALRDGRIVLRDPGNARLTIYDSNGNYSGSLPIPGGSFTSRPMVAAPDGGFYNTNDSRGQPTRMVRYTADMEPVDTLPRPEPRITSTTIRAEREGASQTWLVPFTPSWLWAFHPDGYFLAAASGEYAIDALRIGQPVLRIIRNAVQVPVSPDERAAEEARVTAGMQRLDPAWRWNGPAIPATKPVLRTLHVGQNGRIWAQLYQSGERMSDAERDPGEDGIPAGPQFRESIVFDLFESDGQYVGQVVAPDGFSTSPRPIFGTDHVWAVEHDALGVQRVVRYRIAWP